MVALAYIAASLRLSSSANGLVRQQEKEEVGLVPDDSTPNSDPALRKTTPSTNNDSSVVPRDSLLWSKDVLNNTQLFSLFSTGNVAPILIQQHSRPPRSPVRVRVLLFEHKQRQISFRDDPKTWAISDEVLNICMDGLERSPHFELLNATTVPDFTLQPNFTLLETDDTVWIVDMRRMMINAAYSIGRQLVHLVRRTLEEKMADSGSRGRPSTRRAGPRITVVLMDFRDRIYAKKQCTKAIKELIQILGEENVRIVLQQVVRGRYFDKEMNFPTRGTVWDCRRDVHCLGDLPIFHMPYVVRSDYAEAVTSFFPSFLPPEIRLNSQDLTPSDTARPLDVAHFWKLQDNPEKSHAMLRNKVTELLLALEGEKEWNVTATFVSAAATKGRSRVSSGYLEALLTTKIIVVAQRDRWVDHYRLFEAIIGGAMVMTDPMWGLPEGLVDKRSIIVYRSLDHLKELLEYYLDPSHEDERLSIARAGWTVAISRHRTTNWMERLFFGQQFTD